MSKVLVMIISEHQNGVKLNFPYGLESVASFCSNMTVGSIIDQVKQGYIQIDLKPFTDGKTLNSSKIDGLSQA